MLTPLLRWLAQSLSPYQPLPATAPQDPIAARDGQDATAAIQAALDTGLRVRIPAGHYRVTQPLICRNHGQIIEGEGLGDTVLGFMTTGYPRGMFCLDATHDVQFRDFTVICGQEGVSRGTLTSQAPVFDLRGSARCRFEDLRVERSRTAISLHGNCGGTYVEGCEISAFDRALSITRDGTSYSADSIHVQHCHVWVFGMPDYQQVIQNDGLARSIYCEQADDLNVQGCLFYGAGVTLLDGFGSFANNNFDTAADLDIQGGLWSVVGGSMTGSGIRPLVTARDAEVSLVGINGLFGNLDILNGRAAISVTRGRAVMSGLAVRWGGGRDKSLIHLQDCRASLSGLDLAWLHTNWPTPQPVITVQGGCRASIGQVTCSDVDPAAGQALIRALDTQDQVLVTHGLIAEGRQLMG